MYIERERDTHEYYRNHLQDAEENRILLHFTNFLNFSSNHTLLFSDTITILSFISVTFLIVFSLRH
jgi:hypothetical protein